LGKADLHVHSRYSDGYATVERILEYTERQTDLDVIAITDHDCIDGALRAAELAAKRCYRFQVMTGAEISTRDGHLLALNIRALVPAALSMAETIQAVHEQGGLAIVGAATRRDRSP
jgi:predicted metal-dependent phosphoesterase TrpH